MPTVTRFPQGTPIWVDLQSTDSAAAAEFYSALLGWEVNEPAQAGGYRLAYRGGIPVCAIGSLPEALAQKGAVPVWTTYLAVDDADAATAAVGEAGGTVLLPPGELGNGVRLSIVEDPSGAVVGLWQGAGQPASWLRDEEGAVSWFELLAEHAEESLPFYQSVLGASVSRVESDDAEKSEQLSNPAESVEWVDSVDSEDSEGLVDSGEDAGYPMLEFGGVTIAGVGASDVADLPAHWRVYFEVADLARCVEQVGELGGAVLAEIASAVGVGSWAAVADPQGAVFSLIQPSGLEAEADPAEAKADSAQAAATAEDPREKAA
ncbi:MAG TPA: VOC family protein [Microbacteriaceae bacterium]